MRKLVLLLVIVAGLLLPATVSAETSARVLWLDAEGPVSAVMVQYIERGVTEAQAGGYAAMVLRLNTPGGAIDLMERIVRLLRGSNVPVIVYVAPRGAMAGSAGTVITLAGHLAAMAPETAIGAASPVGSEGEDLDSTIATKEKEILRALVRSLAARRPPEAIALAESTIQDAKAVSSEEALHVGLVDVVADTRAALLTAADGRVVTTAAGDVVLRTADAAVVEFPLTLAELLLQFLTNPNIVFLLLAIGAQAILIELSQPGGWVAGVVGVVCLGLAFYGLGFLPVNWLGLGLILLAFVLFFLELQAPTHGALLITGGVSFIAGALVLFNAGGAAEFQRVSVPLVVGTGIALGAVFFGVIALVWKARRQPPAMGVETLVGCIGEVRQALTPRGQVQAAGELWSAESEDRSTIEEEARVTVVRVDGVRLIVRRAP